MFKHSQKRIRKSVMIFGIIAVVAAGALGACVSMVTDPGAELLVAETTEYAGLELSPGSTVTAPEGALVSMVVDGAEMPIEDGVYRGDVVMVVTEDYSDAPLGSFGQRGGEKFRAGLYVDENGIIEERSVGQAVAGGVYDDAAAEGISITAGSDNFNAVIVNSGEYTLRDAEISLTGGADGSNTSDFSGLGSAVAAYNDAKVVIDSSSIYTEGVARCVLYTDSGADTMITDSEITAMGGTIYDGYVNTADQVKMVAPPWVLGITGNARTTNLMGDLSTTTIVRTDASANQWGVLSTDSGKDMVMVVVDSTLTLKGEGQDNDPFSENYGSGYGTYIIGDAKEYFYGATFNVGTYASILTGGFGYYGSSNFDGIDVYPLKRILTGETAYDWMGNPYDAYVTENADEPVFTGISGEGRTTVINSDAFGFMAHNNGELVITDGTVVNTDNAVFLMKAGDVDITVSGGAQLTTEDGMILQMIDNDDALVGADFSQGPPNFFTEFFEREGYPGINYDVDVTTERRNVVTFTAEDVSLEGDLYNGTGLFGGQAGDVLKVTLGAGSTLTGDISSTSAIHVDENGNQNTYFTINEYYYLGHVANRVYYSGANDVEVTVKSGAVWTVEDECLIAGLALDSVSEIKAPAGKVLTMSVNGVVTDIAAGSYSGNIVLSVADKAMAVISDDTEISSVSTYKDGLVIAKGAELTVPEGKSLTMTVDGVVTNIAPGAYTGEVVLTPTDDYIIGFMVGAPFGAEHKFRMGQYVKDGVVVKEKSVFPSIDGLIESNADKFNGIVIDGNSKYSIDDITIMYTGNGGNDFAGFGAGIMSAGESEVTVTNAFVSTDGVISPAFEGTGNSTLNVKDSKIITGDEASIEGVDAPFMAEVPWMLGIYGNTRATNVLNSARVTYDNCYIEAASWGAMSTDMCSPGAELNVINSEVVVKNSGYGVYADMTVTDTITNSKITVPDYGIIAAGGPASAIVNGGSVINSGRYGVMWHQNLGGTVSISDKSVVNTGMTAFLVKSSAATPAFPNLVVDDAEVNAENGVILHVMDSDDPGMNPNGMPGTDSMFSPFYLIPEVKPVMDGNDVTDAAAENTINASFSNMKVNGNIYNSRWSNGQNLNVEFVNAEIVGQITAGVQQHVGLKPGDKITPDTREMLGNVAVTPHEVYSNGLLVSLDASTSWEVADTSYLSSLKIAEGAVLTAPAGKTLNMFVDGAAVSIAAGNYSGRITLEVK